MKKVILAIFTAFIALGVQAQSNEAEMFASMFNTEKKAALMDFMSLSETEAMAFWPIYQEFETARTEMAKRRIELISVYAQQYGTITDETADIMAKDSFKIRMEQEKLQKKYYGKVKKAIGAKRAAQFIQFERFVNTAIDGKIYDNMPFIGEGM